MSNYPRLVAALDTLSYVLCLVTIVAMPLFVDSHLSNWYVIPKQFLLVGLVLIQGIVFVIRTIVSKRVLFVRSIVDVPVFLIILCAFMSSILSAAVYDSWLGRNDSFVMNFLYLASLALFFFLTLNNISTVRRWLGAINALLIVGAGTAIIFILKIVFHLDILAKIIGPVWNTVDVTNSNFGVWLIVIFILSAGQLLKKNTSVTWQMVYLFFSILSLVAVLLMGFPILWWTMIAGLLMLLCFGISFTHESRVVWLSVLFAGLLLSLVFVIFGMPKALQSNVPAEVSLNISSSWEIAKDTVFSGVKNFLVGSGPGTFGIDFSAHRNIDFNNDQLAWGLRFNRPMNTVLAWLPEVGTVAFVTLIFICAVVAGHALLSWLRFRSNSRNANEEEMPPHSLPRNEVFVVAIAWATLTVGGMFNFFGPVLWWLWWFLLASTVIGLAIIDGGILRVREYNMEDVPQYSLSFSFISIVAAVALLLVGIWVARLYRAEVAYAAALRSSDHSNAESYLNEALYYRSNFDAYHVALAQVYLLKAVDASRAKQPDVLQVSAFLSKAVNEARVATTLSPRSVGIWENLATMYENASTLVVGAREWVFKSLNEANKLEPTNPVLLWRLGNNYAVDGKWEDAMKLYAQAIDLKKDYGAAYVGLATAEEQLGKIDEAINTYQTILPAAGGNSDVLFNYGRLLYNRNHKGDRANARDLWLAIITKQPDSSNVLFSLGLYYESVNDKVTALQYYSKVRDLNPDNKDIAQKIYSLVGAGQPISTPTSSKEFPRSKQR